MRVLDIRGTHGSGKSWIVHQLIDMAEEVRRTLWGLVLDEHIGIVGFYDSQCGGCDQISPADMIEVHVWKMLEGCDIVILEGILVAHTFGRYNQLAEEVGDYRFLFLDTPLNTCIARVCARREAKGEPPDFNPQNLIKDWTQIYVRTRQKLEEAGRYVRVLDHRDPMPAVLEEIRC